MKPQIIPRKEHQISRKQISPNALRTLYRLHRYGFIAYLVGGCVRDLLMEKIPKDFDIVTNATPSQIRRLFRNCRLIGRRFRLAHLHFHDEILEVATFRRDVAPSDKIEIEEAGHNNRPLRHFKNEDGMVLRDNIFGTPEEDALRRDFTINALAYNIADFSIIDYTNGISDLKERLIRPIGDPYVRFTEDPVRMLRAVRFSASHNLSIEPATWEILCTLASTISRVAPSRLYEEIQKLFLLGSAQQVFKLLEKSGLLGALFPGINQWIHGRSHSRTLPYANLGYFDRLYQRGKPSSPVLFMAALFGPGLEEATLLRHRDGIPYQQALDTTCAIFVEEICRPVGIPVKVMNLMRTILALQPSLHRMPPKRPSSIVSKAEFADAITYLRITAETRNEHRTSLAWWDSFLIETPSAIHMESPSNEVPGKRRKKRRRKNRRTDRTTT